MILKEILKNSRKVKLRNSVIEMEIQMKTLKAIDSKKETVTGYLNYSLTDYSKRKGIEMVSLNENWTETLKDSQNSKEKEMGIQNYLETEKEILKKRLKEK